MRIALQAEILGERGGLRFGGDPRVGPAVEQEPVDLLGHEVAAETTRALEHRDRHRTPDFASTKDRRVRRRETGDSAADDDDAPRLRRGHGDSWTEGMTAPTGVASVSAATSASASTKSSSALRDRARTYARPRSAAIWRASMSRS